MQKFYSKFQILFQLLTRNLKRETLRFAKHFFLHLFSHKFDWHSVSRNIRDARYINFKLASIFLKVSSWWKCCYFGKWWNFSNSKSAVNYGEMITLHVILHRFTSNRERLWSRKFEFNAFFCFQVLVDCA